MNISQTKDYKKFDTITGNRVVNQKKVSDLIEDVKSGLNLFKYCPIVVSVKDGKFLIIDGQHRYEACKELNEPIYYVICNELELKDIARLNSRSDKWKNVDFLSCYIEIGLEPYKDLATLLGKYRISYTTGIALLQTNKIAMGGTSLLENFRNGKLKSNYLQEAISILDFTESIFGRYKFCFDRHLIRAVMIIKDTGFCDFEVLKSKIKSNTNLMEKKSNHKEYLNVIEMVYNHRNQRRISIY